MKVSSGPTSLLLPLFMLGSLSLCGCRSPEMAGVHARAQQQAKLSTERQTLEQIPPPTKGRYMTIRSFDSWENPSITVQPDMLTIYIMLADQNPSSFGAGGMLRPAGARRQQVNIEPGKLAEAMAAVPPESWPYGRVVAIEEAHQTPGKEEPVVRRNMEAAISTLNDLGLEAYDLGEGNLR